MDSQPLKIAVVGHTNTGKTSLMRTLLRNPDFGEVADRPGTTRHVEAAALLVDGTPLLELYDTPGLEDPITLLDYLEQLQEAGERIDGVTRVERFLQTREAARRFEQEAKVLRQMLHSDAAFYVVDARSPVLGKHRDELTILAWCARPLLPVLNFVAQPDTRVPEWREALARLGLHAAVEFDTVAPALDGEETLYRKLATLVDARAAGIDRLLENLRRQRLLRRAAATRLGAEMLLDAAAMRLTTPSDAASVEAHLARLREAVQRRENRMVSAVLALYGFRDRDVARTDLPAWPQRLEMDLFHPNAARDMGIQVGMGAAAGAAAGALVDLAVGGLSLGAGALIGAAVGGVWQGYERLDLGNRLVARVRGWRELTVDDSILRLLALRFLLLAETLERRGHAALAPIELPRGETPDLRRDPLPAELLQARSEPDWNPLSKRFEESERRTRAIDGLARQLEQIIEKDLGTGADLR